MILPSQYSLPEITIILISSTIDWFCQFLSLIQLKAYSMHRVVSGLFCSNNVCEIHPYCHVSIFFLLLLYNIPPMNYTTVYLFIIQLMDYCFQFLVCYEQSQHERSCRFFFLGRYICNFFLILPWVDLLIHREMHI